MKQRLIQAPGPLLAPDGSLTAVGGSPHPLPHQIFGNYEGRVVADDGEAFPSGD